MPLFYSERINSHLNHEAYETVCSIFRLVQ